MKESNDCGALRSIGRLFQRRGPAEQRARSPMVRSFVVGPSRMNLLADLRVRGVVLGVLISSCRYGGASPFMQLWVMTRILKSILAETGSQCREKRMGVM